MASTSVARALAVAEAEERRAEVRLEARHLGDVGVERWRRARKDDQLGSEPVGLERLHHRVGRETVSRLIDEAERDPTLAKERRAQEQRVRRFGRAEHLFAFLAAALPRERDAVDERRVDEECAH
jgi:hypothetical protein